MGNKRNVKPPFSTEEIIIKNIEIIKNIAMENKLVIPYDDLRKITMDIMNISYSNGGDYSEKIIESYGKSYFKDKLYEKWFFRD